MRFKVYPYMKGSRSAKALSEALGVKVLRRVGSRYKSSENDCVVNWGSSEAPDLSPALVLNLPGSVRVAGCKLSTLKALSGAGVNIPDCWTNKNIPPNCFPVVCRTKLRGHSGDGIVIANTPEELVDAPLYTQYIKKKDEYRVHVAGREAFFIQRKARKRDVEEPNWMVRNLVGGFVFVESLQDDTPVPVVDEAIKSIHALGLDFGGVDVIWNEREGKAYVLEVNTACGLEEKTADRYASIFRRLCKNNA